MHLSQYKLCIRKMELELEAKFYIDFHWVTRPWRRTLTTGCDVKYVFPGALDTPLLALIKYHHSLYACVVIQQGPDGDRGPQGPEGNDGLEVKAQTTSVFVHIRKEGSLPWCLGIGHHQSEREPGSESIPQRRLGSFGGTGFNQSSKQ